MQSHPTSRIWRHTFSFFFALSAATAALSGLAGCSSSDDDNNGSPDGSENPGGGGNRKAQGDACTCAKHEASAFNQCQSTEGPCESSLVCEGTGSNGVCAKKCTGPNDCSDGFSCTIVVYQGATMGKFCHRS